MVCNPCVESCIYRRSRKCRVDAFKPEPAPARATSARKDGEDPEETGPPDYTPTGESVEDE